MENDETSFTSSTANRPTTDETSGSQTDTIKLGQSAAGGSYPPPPPPHVVSGPRRLYRTVGPVSGVSAGLAKYFRIDPVVVRIAIMAASIVGFPMVPLAYIAAWIIIPKADPSPVAPIMAPNPASRPASSAVVHPDAPAAQPESLSA